MRLCDIGNQTPLFINSGSPMTKNSTSSSTVLPEHAEITKQGPAKLTLAKIRQFARSYTFVPVEIPSLGGIIAN